MEPGTDQKILADFDVVIDEPRYVFFCLKQNPVVSVRCSEQRLTGILAVSNGQNPAVSNYGKQAPEQDIGVESFEFWCPERRPVGQNLALTIEPPLDLFTPQNVINGWARPTSAPNAWVAAFDDPLPTISLEWDQPQTIAQLCLVFDTDFDHPMESVQYGHPETAMPFCVKHYRIKDATGNIVAESKDNHQSRNWITFDAPMNTKRLTIEVLDSHAMVPAALFELACYAEREDLLKNNS